MSSRVHLKKPGENPPTMTLSPALRPRGTRVGRELTRGQGRPGVQVLPAVTQPSLCAPRGLVAC